MSRNRTQIVIAAFLFCLLGTRGTAQDFKQDLVKMQAAYAGIKNLVANVEINVYSSAFSTALLVKKTALLKKEEDNYYYELGDIFMLLNKKHSILANKEDKQIVYSERDVKEEKKYAYSFISPSLDSVFKTYDSVAFKGIESGQKKYTVYTGRSLIVKTDIVLNENTFFITKVIYYYDPQKIPTGNKVMIEYKSMDTSPVFSKNDFSDSIFIRFSGNNAYPAARFAGYYVFEMNPDDL